MSTQTLDAYSELLLEHRPAVPSNEREHARMVTILEAMELNGRKLTRAEERLADLIAAAILTYEERHCPPMDLAPHEILVRLMENRSMTQAALARVLSISRTTASHIYHGTQGISKKIALQLAKHFSIDVTAFLQ